MKKPSLLIALLLISSIAAAPLPYVQQLRTGTWTGTATPPEGMTTNVIFTVDWVEDELAISLEIPEAGMTFDAIAPRVENDSIVFSLDIQSDVLDCNLARQDDGSYKGPCIDEGGGEGTVVMVPPAG